MSAVTPEFRSGALADTVRAVADDLLDMACAIETTVDKQSADWLTARADRLRAALEEVGEHP